MSSHCFFATHCFRTRSDFEGDGFLLFEDCVISIDAVKCLCLFNFEDAMNEIWDKSLLTIRLDGAETTDIGFKKISSAGGSHTMGRVCLKGFYRDARHEKITFKMQLPKYNKAVRLVLSW